MSQAFKPLGVYINFFQPQLEKGAEQEFTVMLVNDDSETARGSFVALARKRKGRDHRASVRAVFGGSPRPADAVR